MASSRSYRLLVGAVLVVIAASTTPPATASGPGKAWTRVPDRVTVDAAPSDTVVDGLAVGTTPGPGEGYEVRWRVDDEPASPDADGLLTGLTPGRRTVSVTYTDGARTTERSMDVTVPHVLSLDWRMPDRYDGTADTWARSPAEVDPGEWRLEVTVDGPGFACAEDLAAGWTSPDHPINAVPTGPCSWRVDVPEEGVYRTQVTLTDPSTGDLVARSWSGLPGGSPLTPIRVRNHLVVALGDSYLAGEGAPLSGCPDGGGFTGLVGLVLSQVTDSDRSPAVSCAQGVVWSDATDPALAAGDTACHRSPASAPARAAAAVEQADPRMSVTFVNLACSGVTMERGVLGPYQPAFLGLDTVEPLPAQVDQLRDLVGDRTVDELLVSVGANDIGFGSVLEECTRHRGCPDRDGGSRVPNHEEGITLDEAIRRSLADLPAAFDDLEACLRPGDDCPGGEPIDVDRVLQLEYYDPTTGPDGLCEEMAAEWLPLPTVGIDVEEATWASAALVDGLNAAVHANAARGWEVVEGPATLFDGRGYCAEEDRLVVTVADSIAQQGDPLGAFHPNADGHLLLADLLATELARP